MVPQSRLRQSSRCARIKAASKNPSSEFPVVMTELLTIHLLDKEIAMVTTNTRGRAFAGLLRSK